jgi:hypothetical protein
LVNFKAGADGPPFDQILLAFEGQNPQAGTFGINRNDGTSNKFLGRCLDRCQYGAAKRFRRKDVVSHQYDTGPATFGCRKDGCEV